MRMLFSGVSPTRQLCVQPSSRALGASRSSPLFFWSALGLWPSASNKSRPVRPGSRNPTPPGGAQSPDHWNTPAKTQTQACYQRSLWSNPNRASHDIQEDYICWQIHIHWLCLMNLLFLACCTILHHFCQKLSFFFSLYNSQYQKLFIILLLFIDLLLLTYSFI